MQWKVQGFCEGLYKLSQILRWRCQYSGCDVMLDDVHYRVHRKYCEQHRPVKRKENLKKYSQKHYDVKRKNRKSKLGSLKQYLDDKRVCTIKQIQSDLQIPHHSLRTYFYMLRKDGHQIFYWKKRYYYGGRK